MISVQSFQMKLERISSKRISEENIPKNAIIIKITVSIPFPAILERIIRE